MSTNLGENASPGSSVFSKWMLLVTRHASLACGILAFYLKSHNGKTLCHCCFLLCKNDNNTNNDDNLAKTRIFAVVILYILCEKGLLSLNSLVSDHHRGLSVCCLQNYVGRVVFCFLAGLLQSFNLVLPTGKAPKVPLHCKHKYTSNHHPPYHLGQPSEVWP